MNVKMKQIFSFSFENKPAKYRLVQLEDRVGGKKLRDVDFNLQSPHASKLPQYVQDLIKEIVSLYTYIYINYIIIILHTCIQSHPCYLDLWEHWIHIWMIGVPDNIWKLPTPLKKNVNLQINVAGDNGGSWMYVYLQWILY